MFGNEKRESLVWMSLCVQHRGKHRTHSDQNITRKFESHRRKDTFVYYDYNTKNES